MGVYFIQCVTPHLYKPCETAGMICVCVYVRVCAFVHMCVCVWVSVWVCVSMHVWVCTYLCFYPIIDSSCGVQRQLINLGAVLQKSSNRGWQMVATDGLESCQK